MLALIPLILTALTADDRRAVVQTRVAPEATQEARDRMVTGSVFIQVEISPEGRVTETRLARTQLRIEGTEAPASADYGLVANALEAALLWRFQPAILAGQPVPDRQVVELSFDAPSPTESSAERIGGGVQPPRMKQRREPGYAERARQAGVEGKVLMAVVIGADGVPQEIRVLGWLPRNNELPPQDGHDFGLKRQAVLALSEWRFEPSVRNGQPVPVRANVEMNFSLLSKSGALAGAGAR